VSQPTPARALAASICLLVGSVLTGFGTISVYLLEGAHVAASRSGEEASPSTPETAAEKAQEPKGHDEAACGKMRLMAAGILLVGCLLLFAGLAPRTGGMRIGVSVLVAIAADLGAAAGGWLKHGVLGVGLALAAGCVLLGFLALRLLRRGKAGTPSAPTPQ